jgi:hypothetical protein
VEREADPFVILGIRERPFAADAPSGPISTNQSERPSQKGYSTKVTVALTYEERSEPCDENNIMDYASVDGRERMRSETFTKRQISVEQAGSRLEQGRAGARQDLKSLRMKRCD